MSGAAVVGLILRYYIGYLQILAQTLRDIFFGYALEAPSVLCYTENMRDFNNEFLEFKKEFDTAKSCRDYLFAMCYPEGFRCPYCQHDKFTKLNEIKFKCHKCKKQPSLYLGTKFQGTQYKKLPCWFKAIWYVSAGGTNASEMEIISSIGSNNTALKWFRDLERIKLNSNEYIAKSSITFRELLQNVIDTAP